MPFDSAPQIGDPGTEFVEKDNWRHVLLEAADLIRKKGLAKGRQQDAKGRLCLHGAIAVAAGDGADAFHESELNCTASRKVAQYLRSLGAKDVTETGAAYWNNKPERTADEVISALWGAAFSNL